MRWMQEVAACTTEEEAEALFHDILMADYLGEHIRPPWHPDQAVSALRESIGYAAGYQDHETASRIYRLFKCEHPIFGTDDPTFLQAFWSGMRCAYEKGSKLSMRELRQMVKHTKDVKRWRKVKS